MNVARLKAWLVRLLAPVAAALRLSTEHAAPRRDRTLAAASADPYRSGLASGNWLEDARRLRAHPLPRHGSAAPSREHVHQILHDPHWAAAYNASQAEHFPRSAPSADARDGERQLRRNETASRPLASPAPQPARDAGPTNPLRERRRLVYVRELVRRGIYNEGFTPGTMPDQYRPRPDRDAGTGPLPLDE